MKFADIRRILVLMSLLCIFLFFYLYWQQQLEQQANANFARIFYSYDKPIRNKKLEKRQEQLQKQQQQPLKTPQWTWMCINQRCERHSISSNDKPAGFNLNPFKSSTNDRNDNTKLQQQQSNGVLIQSLETCSMVCGSSQLWPQPTGPITLGTRTHTIQPQHIQFEHAIYQQPAKRLLDNALNIFNDTVTEKSVLDLKKDGKADDDNDDADEGADKSPMVLIKIHIDNQNEVNILLNTSERYNLTIHTVEKKRIDVSINAVNFFGARHALETLSQLIWYDVYASSLKILQTAQIVDEPKFGYRGVMVDTARNFMSLNSLKRTIIAMAANKLNVFHWHVTDSQSFPLEIRKYLDFTKDGAYSLDEVYQSGDVQDLVEFARGYGVRVVIEVDVPAHAGNGWRWGLKRGLGNLAICVNERPWSLYCGEPPCGQLNPENQNVYNVLEDLYKEIAEMTGEYELAHIGGDEVNLDCWSQYLPKLASNYTDLHDLWGEFTQKAAARLKRVLNLNKTTSSTKKHNILIWSSNLSKRPFLQRYLSRDDYIVQVWGASQWPETHELLNDGYRILVSHVDAWYLDCGFGRWRETGYAACDPYRPWQTVYLHRPWSHLSMEQRHRQIIGGEVCLWSEQVDESALDGRLWPRAAAFAERVWSDPGPNPVSVGNGGGGSSGMSGSQNFNNNNEEMISSLSSSFSTSISEDIYTRLNTQRDRMVARGIEAEAMWPQWCVQNPGMCL